MGKRIVCYIHLSKKCILFFWITAFFLDSLGYRLFRILPLYWILLDIVSFRSVFTWHTFLLVSEVFLTYLLFVAYRVVMQEVFGSVIQGILGVLSIIFEDLALVSDIPCLLRLVDSDKYLNLNFMLKTKLNQKVFGLFLMY